MFTFGNGEQVILTATSVFGKMTGRLGRFLQTIFVALLVAYSTLFVYQAFNNRDLNIRNVVNQNGNDNYVLGERAEEILSTVATVGPPTTSLDDIFISVKTSKVYYNNRLMVILQTWFQMAKAQTWFFTDSNAPELQTATNGHLINTNCSSTHHRKALCCKMSVEFDTYLSTDKKWFCHFDDDNYVNIPRLVRFLGDYNHREDWYLGKTSIKAPLEIYIKNKRKQKVKFWFATGGAGFCLSRSLALKMLPVVGGGKFISIGDKIHLPDDVTMGYVIEHLMRTPLTVVDQFHSHLEPMKLLRKELFSDQISFSYKGKNVVKIDGYKPTEDPTRFLSIHCFLFPHSNFCQR